MRTLFDLGFTKAYRRLEQAVADTYRNRKAVAVERIRARNATQRRNAAITLLLDDAKFHGVNPASLLGAEHEEQMPHSFVGEDFPDGL